MRRIEERYTTIAPHQQSILENSIVGLNQDPVSIVRDPIRVRTLGCPSGTSAFQKSTLRKPSAFELVGSSNKNVRKRKCGECQQGHDRTDIPAN
jgi:hypothetical protein